MNAAVYDVASNAVITSSPTQSMVISVDADTSEINWIFGPHDGYNEEKSPFRTPVKSPYHAQVSQQISIDAGWGWV